MMTALFIVLLLILITAAYGGYRAAIWVPLSHADVTRSFDLADIKPGDVVYDLGCGDGRLIEAAAARGATAIGYEVSLVPYVLALYKKMRSPHRKNMKIRFADFWFKDLSDADVVFIFLLKDVYPKLIKKLRTECKPGIKLVTHVWGTDELEEIAVSHVEKSSDVFVYRVE